jgi:multidrug/hemolysin transport system permease protein
MYILFLGKMQSDNLGGAFGDTEGIDWLVSAWIMAGILMVSTVTVPLGAVGKLIDDRTKGMLNDFYSSPINRNTLALSYLISAWVIGFIMVFFNFVIGQIYVLLQGGELFSFVQILQLLGLIMFSIMTFSSFFFYLSLHIKTENAYGTLSTLVGTFIGFMGGIYIPIGVLGENVQKVMNLFPTAHAVTVIRRVYMEGAIDKVFTGAPTDIYDRYADLYGLNVNIGNFAMESWHMVLSMLAFMVIFYTLSVLKLSRTKL